MTADTYPPGPKHLLPGQLLFQFYRDALGLLQRMAREHGDIVHVQMGRQHVVMLNHPDLIKEVFVTQQRHFIKNKTNDQEWDAFLGQGLLTSDGDFHMHQRRIIEHAFHGERVNAYGAVMADYAARLADSWQDGATLDIAHEMMQLALSIVGKALFDVSVGSSDVEQISRSLAAALRFVKLLRLPFARILEKLPLPITRDLHRASADLDALIYRLIDEHRRQGADQGDLMSMLLGSGMTDKQVRDEAMTMLIAGHETTANALTWSWHLLSQHPQAEAMLHAEVDRVLRDRSPTVQDLPQLAFTDSVFREALRLYPPGWVSSRQSIEPVTIAGYAFPTGTLFLMCQYVVHRDPRFFAEPERFDPDRWTPAFKAALPRFAYFPFGGGPRQCIGEHFAWMEGPLVLATVARKWRLRAVPGHKVVAQPVVMLRVKNGLPMIVERRAAAAGGHTG